MIQTHTACELTVLAKLTAEQIAELAPLIEEMKPSDPDVAEALAENSLIHFESVFEGDLSMDVLRWFASSRVPYLWQWRAFEDVGAGAQFYQVDADHIHQIRLHENLAVLPLGQASDPAKVKDLRDAIVALNLLLYDLGINKTTF